MQQFTMVNATHRLTRPFLHQGRHPAQPILLAAALLTGLAGCSTTMPEPGPATSPVITHSDPASNNPASPAEAPQAAESQWRLATGELVIHVGKAGRLARLGHNHLVASDQLTGIVKTSNNNSLEAELRLNVSTFTVDDPQRRAHYRTLDPKWATAYRSTPSSKNIADTRANMLGSKVLNAATYPAISVLATAPDAASEFLLSAAGSVTTELSLHIAGQASRLPALLQWTQTPDGGVSWHCNFEVTHAELGMQPFSALGGALSVAELLEIEVRGTLVRSGTVQTGEPSVRRKNIAELDPNTASQPAR